MRRSLLMLSACLALGCARTPLPAALAAPPPDDYGCAARRSPENRLGTPAEHLMREHGVFERVMLIYEEAARRLDRNAELPPDVVPGAAKLVQTYLEQYHEDAEEKLVFPRFEKAIVQVKLVRALKAEHEEGRAITSDLLMLAAAPPQDGVERARIAQRLRAFVKLYRPHVAREDSALFPALSDLLTADETRALAELLDARERRLFGDQGFERVVAEVTVLEKKLVASASGVATLSE